MRCQRKKSPLFYFLSLPLAGVVLFFAASAASSVASRVEVQCSAVDGRQRTSFICGLVGSSGLDRFSPDSYGGVLGLGGGGGGKSLPIVVGNATVGPSGRGGARMIDGRVQIVDGAGRVTYDNYVARDVLPFSPTAASVAIIGNAGASPVSFNMVSPVAGVASGSAVFIGDADSISIDVSGRRGLDGRPAGVAAAFQVLQGELGLSPSVTALIGGMGLGPNLSEPSLSSGDLASSAGLCEQVPGGQLRTPLAGPGELFSVGTTTRARELLVQRNICQRATSEEFSIQTVCARPPQVSSTLRCQYPNIQRFSPVWRRPSISQKTSISCAKSVPYGSWETTCAEETYAVAGSVLRPEYITLKPSGTITSGMARVIHHHFSPTSGPCAVDPPGGSWPDQVFKDHMAAFGRDCNLTSSKNLILANIGGNCPQIDLYTAYVTSPEWASRSFSRVFPNDDGTSQPEIGDQVSAACDGSPMTKMDKLRTTGALVYRYDRSAMPGTAGEQGEGPEDTVTKLSYWVNRSSSPLDSLSYHRNAYDDLNGRVAADYVTPLETADPLAQPADRPFAYHRLDPASAAADGLSGEASARTAYFSGLASLGFARPSVKNAVISYDSLSVSRVATDASKSWEAPGSSGMSGMSGPACTSADTCENAGRLKDIICNLASLYVPPPGAAGASCGAACLCERVMADFGATGGGSVAANLRFREKLDYTFENLRAGLALRHTPAPGDGPASVVRSITERPVEFEPRAIYIPGDLSISPVTKVSYCRQIQIDPVDEDLVTTNVPTEFIGPEQAGGASISIYGYNSPTDKPQFFNLSPEPASSSLYVSGSSNLAPNLNLSPWSNSFMRVKTVDDFRTKNVSCEPVEVSHTLSSGEKAVLESFKSLNGVLLTAYAGADGRQHVTVYFSPVKVPASGTIKFKGSLSPGLYMPLVNVSPMSLSVDGGHHGFNLWGGGGVPARAGDLGNPGNSQWEEGATYSREGTPFPQTTSATLSAQFNLGISYYAVPALRGVPNRDSDLSYPARSFTAEGTRTLSGTLPSGEAEVRTYQGSTTAGRPRYIKSLLSLDLAVSGQNPAGSVTTINKSNVRSYGRALLTTKVGGRSVGGGEASARCLTPNMIGKLKYPTKLISRRAEASTSAGGTSLATTLPLGGDGDPNVVVDTEVSSATGPVNNYVSGNLFFTRPYIPTTMRGSLGPSGTDGTLEEPINLAQDYNSFLAQIQTNLSLSVENAGSSGQRVSLRPAWRTPDCGQPGKLACPSGNPTGLTPGVYDATVTRAGVRWRLRLIGDRKTDFVPYNTGKGGVPGQNPSQEWYGHEGRPPVSASEAACFGTPQTGVGTNPAAYCYEYRPDDIYRANRVPFSVFGAGSAGYSASGFQLVIPRSRTPIFRGVRPFEQYYKDNSWKDSYVDIFGVVGKRSLVRNELNADCENSENAPGRGWLERDECYQNFNFFSGQFFPFLRTKAWLYWGTRNGQNSAPGPFSATPSGGVVTLAPDVYNPEQMDPVPSKTGQPNPPPTRDPQAKDVLPVASLYQQYGWAETLSDRVIAGPGYSQGSPYTQAPQDDGGASINPGGMYLPPFGVRAPIYFSRFLETFNQDCGKIIWDFGASRWLNDGGCTDAHDYEAAFHLFHGSPRQLDYFGKGGSQQPGGVGEDAASGQAPLDHLLTNDASLEWIGTSGFLFNDCDDTLAADETISPLATTVADQALSGTPAPTAGQVVSPHAVKMEGDFSLAFLPLGLASAPDGGLYYGPLLGSDLTPFIGPPPAGAGASGGYNQAGSYFTNALIVLPGRRQTSGVPEYSSQSLFGQITRADFAAPSAAVKLRRGGEAARLTTLGRAIGDAAADLQTVVNSPKFTYEPAVAMIPEVLASFFIHSDLGGSAAVKNGANLNPYTASGPLARPFYFDEVIGPFLSAGVKAAIQEAGFQKNQFAAKDALTVRPMIFNLAYLGERRSQQTSPAYLDPTIRFAWQLDGMSLHMSVVGVNDTTGPSGNTTGLASGVAVAYGPSGQGMFGDMTDSREVLRGGQQSSALRSDGLGDATVRDTKLVLHQVGRQQGTAVAFYVDPNEQATGVRPWAFAENYCSARRAAAAFGSSGAYLKGADHFTLMKIPADSSPSIAGTNPLLSPYDPICSAAAVARQAEIDPSTNRLSAANYIATPCQPLTGMSATGGAILNPCNLQTKDTDVTKNVYWRFVKVDQGKTYPANGTATDPASPPGCPVGTLKSQIFRISESSPSVTYTAASTPAWTAADGSAAAFSPGSSVNPSCPDAVDKMTGEKTHQHEVGTVYQRLYTDPALCYGTVTGTSVPDGRAPAGGGRQVASCRPPAEYCSMPGVSDLSQCVEKGGVVLGGTGGTGGAGGGETFFATVVETPPGDYQLQGSVPVVSYVAPKSGDLSAYTIFSGIRETDLLTAEQISPASLAKKTSAGDAGAVFDQATSTYWLAVGDGQTITYPACDVIPYDPQSGGAAFDAPGGMPVLSASWSFLETQRRYGTLDPYYVKTTPKQTIISSAAAGASAQTIAAAADSCSWRGGVGQAGGPEDSRPRRRLGASADPSAPAAVPAPEDYLDFTYPVSYDWLAGATSTVTSMQYTPWSDERADGQITAAPDCSIFNDRSAVARENTFPMPAADTPPGGDGSSSAAGGTGGLGETFTIGVSPLSTSYLLNKKGSPDSSLNNTSRQFVTGGTWTAVGQERLNLTSANSAVPVSCRIFTTSADGTDTCDAAVALTYQTVEGFQLVTRAENGENGGSSGQTVVMTTFKPTDLTIKADPGAGGRAGGVSLGGEQAERSMVCYEPGKDPLNPAMKIYRFNRSSVTVAPGQAGAKGGSGSSQSFFGWGIMPEAAEWLGRTILNNAAQTQPLPPP